MSSELVFPYRDSEVPVEVASIPGVITFDSEDLVRYSQQARLVGPLGQTVVSSSTLKPALKEDDTVTKPTSNATKRGSQAIIELGLFKAVNGPPKKTQCEANPDAFYIIRERSVHTEAAKAACRNCLSRVACLEDNLDNADPMVYGGLTNVERDKLRRRSNKPYKK